MSYTSEVLADSPSVYYRLGEPSGVTATDAGANALNGVYTNTPTLGVVGAIADGNTAAAFASASLQYVTTPHNALLNLADIVTMEAWIKRSATQGTNQAIVSKGAQTSGAYYLRMGTGNKLEFVRSNVALIVASTNTITDTTTWHHVVGTKNGATVKLYVDNVDVTGVVTNSTLANSTSALTIGADTGGGGVLSEYADLSIDEVAVYPTALSLARVAAHYTAAPVVSAVAASGDSAAKFLALAHIL